MFRINFTLLLICGILSFSYAQDSLKKTAPVKAKPALVKPNPLYKPYRYRRYHAKTDSAAIKNAALQPVSAKPDSTRTAPVIVDKSLNGQYQFLLTKIYRYQQPPIDAFWKSVRDSLRSDRQTLKSAQGQLNIRTKTIDSLKSEIGDKNQQLVAASHAGGVDIFGLFLSRTAYNLIVWGLVAVFAIVTIVVIARSGSFKREARTRTELYTELEEEFKAYKAKANDKEKKLARELQTERNKLDELLGR